MIDVLLGLQWGDEGKGKIVDYLADKYDIIARFQGGPNAGHTLYVNGEKVVLHTIPSGVFHNHCLNLIGNGVVIDPVTLQAEMKKIVPLCPDLLSRLYVSQKAHLILPTHRALDAASEAAKGKDKIGSTLKGIGPAYMDKTGRNGLRVGDILSKNFREKYDKLTQKHKDMLKQYDNVVEWQQWEPAFFEAIEELKKLQIVNGEYWLDTHMKAGKTVLAEGAQGSMLDVDFGTYPFVTSSNTISAGVCNGLGVAPQRIGEVFGITKAYCTRVGGGPFPTELHDETGEALRKAGSEFGATTGRPRRCGWIDLVALRYAVMLSGVTKLIMTKTDVLDNFTPIKAAVAYIADGKETEEFPYDVTDDVSLEPVYKEFAGWGEPLTGVTEYDALPQDFKDYCKFVEQFLGTKIAYISNGTGRNQLIVI
ncbi:adenylosuccinate synthase [Flavipsychrobacter stenotrophus]|uniref:Adenylosuccinate synthetase n=1 Tax=Flavipsychrobacter stenotrophus TaxID=2077091 RepID=A0A2S7SUK1_9BACT|nr:adenylosuccinate synthase [Flavipsychrobacter stenotrophus]PQJ10275.1 adenylosuccinate synthase [Flavipsychrobacter stenotrophus]